MIFHFLIYESFWTAELTRPFLYKIKGLNRNMFSCEFFKKELRIPQKNQVQYFFFNFSIPTEPQKIHYITSIIYWKKYFISMDFPCKPYFFPTMFRQIGTWTWFSNTFFKWELFFSRNFISKIELLRKITSYCIVTVDTGRL